MVKGMRQGCILLLFISHIDSEATMRRGDLKNIEACLQTGGIKVDRYADGTIRIVSVFVVYMKLPRRINQ